MIFKRFAANLRAQNWFAIGIELTIVIVGVFVGTLVANWNQERIEQRDVDAIVGKLGTDVALQLAKVTPTTRTMRPPTVTPPRHLPAGATTPPSATAIS